MFEKLKKNKKTSITLLVATILVLAGIGYTIAYFMTILSGSPRTISSGTLTITYTNESTLNLTNMVPLQESEITSKAAQVSFRVKNTGNVKGYVELNLSSISMSSSLKNADLKYMLYDVTSNKEITNGNFAFASSKVNVINDLEFAAGTYKDYKLYVYIEETPENQIAMANGTLTATVEAIGKSRRTNIPNSPKLVNGMVPVIYNESSDVWQVADTATNWYNYKNQQWANAVTVNNATYRTASAGTPIPMENIDTMWVWIPRYKYKITSNIGSTSNITNPPQIDVVFESGTQTTGTALSSCGISATNCYYTHPAFRDGTTAQLVTSTQSTNGTHTGWDSELSGIWVGKFETGGTASKPLIKPDIQSLKNQNVSTEFQTSLVFAGGIMNTSTGAVTYSTNQYGLTRNSTTDSHMMKNTEWGAVAYLSQSKYGKSGNINYSGANKEIYINNSSSMYTGRSYGTTNTSNVSTTYGTYGYNNKSCSTISSNACTGSKTANAGIGASTAGTIYGVYDMSGGTWEYTMSNWAGYSGYSSSSNSGFSGPNGGDSSTTSGISFPSAKYYDKYTGTSWGATTSSNSIKGDATYETERWYSDGASFVYASYPWAFRSSRYNENVYAGIFYFGSIMGTNGYGFRSVLIP